MAAVAVVADLVLHLPLVLACCSRREAAAAAVAVVGVEFVVVVVDPAVPVPCWSASCSTAPAPGGLLPESGRGNIPFRYLLHGL